MRWSMTVQHSTPTADDPIDQTLDIEVRYVRGNHARDADPLDPEGDIYELARDLGAVGPETFERRDVDAADAIGRATVSLGAAEVDAAPFDDIQGVLEHVYLRCQGPGKWGDLYDGAEYRSMQTGDVIVVGMVPYMVAPVGFEAIDADLEPDASAFVEDGEYVWIERDDGSLKGATVVETDGPFAVVEKEGVRDSGREQVHVDELAVPRYDEGEDVVVTYDGSYSDGRVEKRGTIASVQEGRGFRRYLLATDAGDTLALRAGHGPVRSRNAGRRIGTDWELTSVEERD